MGLIDDIRKDRAIGTPDFGGWSWFGGRDSLYLATKRRGRRFVMGFIRKGMRSAQPTFQVGGVMLGAIDELTEYEVGDGSARGQPEAIKDPTVYRLDVKSVDHPDARRIARVPDMEAALLAAEDLADLLDDVQRQGCEVCSGDCASATPLVGYCPMQNISRALEAYRAATKGGDS